MFWVGLLIVVLPFLGLLGSSTNNSSSTLPPGAPSQVAQQQLQEFFPNQTVGSSSIVLLVGSNITGPVGQHSTLAVGMAIETNSSLTYVGSVDSLYTSYQSYLDGEAQLALGFLGPALSASPSLPVAVNDTATLLIGPAAGFYATWSELNASHPGVNATSWNWPAYVATAAAIGNNTASVRVLNAFYSGANAFHDGFNGTLACANVPATALACADSAVDSQVGILIPGLFPTTADQTLASVSLATLGIANYSAPLSQRTTATVYLSVVSGLPAAWMGEVWAEYPSGVATPEEVTTWTTNIVANESVRSYPLPIPLSIAQQFVNSANSATLIYVGFTVADDYTTSSGGTPVYDNVGHINSIVPSVLAETDPTHSLTFYQTGPAPLDLAESTVLSSSVSLVLPLTFVVLLIITVIYFRAPLAPLATFGGLGIALVIGLGCVVLLGQLVGKVDVTSIELMSVFVLGVGTDYSIFLLARYREELQQGAEHRDAVVTAVAWAGQSIATSGVAAVVATLALTFSGVALLSQWGMVLSLSILGTLLIALTLVPAVITLVGPRIFWPYPGGRPRPHETVANGYKDPDTYFYRTGRRTQRHPAIIVAVVLVASIPLVYVALNVPLSYDFYQQLPQDQSATQGLTELNNQFGPGFAFPMLVLVTFAAPLLVGNVTNATEFADLSAITSSVSNTNGVASVTSPVGPTGATLAQWVGFASLPPGTQSQLRGVLGSYVGTNGATVLLTVVASSGGLSAEAVQLLGTLKSTLHAYEASHPSVVGLAFGGGASVTNDLQQSTEAATVRLVIAVSIGLIIVLFVVLRSFWLPLLAVATIGLSIGWAWGVTGLVLDKGLGIPLFFFAPTILFILILGLGIDYNIFVLTRVREERLRGHHNSEAVVHALGRTGGIITAAAVILASAFGVLLAGSFLLLQVIGFAVATAILLDAMIVRTYLVPSILQLLGERAWAFFGRRPRVEAKGAAAPPSPEGSPASDRGTALGPE
jgi:RND superfamily putative drug exporter